MVINDLIMFSKKENIYLENDEYLYLFNVIKENWSKLINDEELVKIYLTNKFEGEKYNKIYNLFLKYKKKYSSYL